MRRYKKGKATKERLQFSLTPQRRNRAITADKKQCNIVDVMRQATDEIERKKIANMNGGKSHKSERGGDAGQPKSRKKNR